MYDTIKKELEEGGLEENYYRIEEEGIQSEENDFYINESKTVERTPNKP